MKEVKDLSKILLLGFGVVSIVVGVAVTLAALLKRTPKLEDDFED